MHRPQHGIAAFVVVILSLPVNAAPAQTPNRFIGNTLETWGSDKWKFCVDKIDKCRSLELKGYRHLVYFSADGTVFDYETAGAVEKAMIGNWITDNNISDRWLLNESSITYEQKQDLNIRQKRLNVFLRRIFTFQGNRCTVKTTLDMGNPRITTSISTRLDRCVLLKGKRQR